jgi:hypothetical protein
MRDTEAVMYSLATYSGQIMAREETLVCVKVRMRSRIDGNKNIPKPYGSLALMTVRWR